MNLIEENENNKTDDLLIRGTSYIINKRTAQRMGFKVVKTDSIQHLILLFNYFNVLTTYSLAKGKLSFPKLTETKTFEAKLTELAERKGDIARLSEMMKGALAKS